MITVSWGKATGSKSTFLPREGL